MDNQDYQNNGNNNNGNNGGGGQKRQSLFLLLVASLITLICMSFFVNYMNKSSSREISYDQFLAMVEAGRVESV